MQSTAIVKIQGAELAPITYNGQRVITLGQIDKAHKRPANTARKRFNDNRKYFVNGHDCFLVSPSEFRTSSPDAFHPKNNSLTTVLTKSGYLMLVKSLTDDLSWAVQRDMAEKYFLAEELAAKAEATALDTVQTPPSALLAGDWDSFFDNKEAVLSLTTYATAKIAELKQEVKVLAPKAEAHDQLMKADKGQKVHEVAKALGFGSARLL
jgi:hypothetical protein